jgi:hypothetical protein
MRAHPAFEDGQDNRDRAFEFACRVVKFCRQLSDGGGVGRLMVPQLLSCTLSFATMLEEARGAESDADFAARSTRTGSGRQRADRNCDDDHQEQAEERRGDTRGRESRATRAHEFQIPNS